MYVFASLTSDEDPSQVTSIELSPEESHHLIKVKRARLGDALRVLDGKGRLWEGTLSDASAKAARVAVCAYHQAPEPVPSLELVLALPKLKTVEILYKLCTELGLSRLQLIETAHSQRFARARVQKLCQERLPLIGIEACKQSGNPFLPKVSPLMSLTEYLRSWPAAPISASSGSTRAFIASLAPETTSFAAFMGASARPENALLPRDAKAQSRDKIYAFVGPEGGFSYAEDAAIRAAGAAPISLGPYILRVETAILAFLSLLRASASFHSE